MGRTISVEAREQYCQGELRLTTYAFGNQTDSETSIENLARNIHEKYNLSKLDTLVLSSPNPEIRCTGWKENTLIRPLNSAESGQLAAEMSNLAIK